MSAESTIYDALRLYAPLIAAVGARIYPDAIAEDEPLPAIVFTRGGTEPIYTIDGTLHAERVSMSVEALASSRTEAEDTCNQAVAALRAAGLYHSNRGSTVWPEVGAYSATVDVDVWV